MKKFLFIALTAALLASCQNNPSDSDNNQNTPPQNQTVTLQSRLQSAEPGTTIDLESEKLSVTDNGSYTIDKALTIKNGDLKNATFTVKATGVKFDKMKNISNINVAEEVGNGDFSVINCNEIDEINVNGGGANSIHIENTTVLKLIVQKKDVRIVLKNNDTTSVKNTLIFADCKLDAETGSSFENVIINSGVTKLELAGNVVIEKITALESSSATISITAPTVKINSADSIIKANLKNAAGSTVDTSEIKDAALTDAEKEELEKDIFNSKLNFTPSDKEKVTVEKKDNEFVIKNTDAVAFKNNNIWNKCIYTKEKLPVESNKNYQISVDLKSDKESLVFFGAKDISANTTIGKYVKLGTEYKTYTVETGTIGNKGWIKGEFLIAVGCAEVVYVKNFKITPIEKNALPVACWANNEDELENISATGTSNGAKFEFTKDAKGKNQRGSDIILSKNELDCGESYEINFEITSDVDLAEGELGIWTHIGNNITDSTGSDKITLKAGEKTKIDFFVHSFQLKEETFRIPYISFLPNKKCNLTIENIQTIETTKEEYLSKYPDTSLYFAGDINGSWSVRKDLDSITIPANGEVYFVLLYANPPDYYDDPWSSLEPYPIEFKMPNVSSLSQKQNKDGEDKLYFKNPESEPVVAKFSLTDDCKVDVTYKKTNASWYYIDIDKSLLPKDTTKLNYIFNNNNGIQSFDADFELTDKSVYCFIKYGDLFKEYGNRKYWSVVSERTDNPTTEPDEGFIRLYFYSELSKLPETPYAFLWTSEPEFWQNNAWPGIEMTKFE